MRPLACVAFSFSAYCFAYTYLNFPFPSPLVWLLLLIASCIAFIPRVKSLRIAALALAGISIAGLWTLFYESTVHAPAAELMGSECEISATALDHSYQSTYGSTRVEVKIHSPVKAKAIVRLDESLSVKPGDTLTLTAYIDSTSNESVSRHYASRGFFITASQTGEVSIDEGSQNLIKYLPKHISHKIKQQVLSLFESEDGAIITALLTGDKTELNKNDELIYDLQRSGLSHLVAVSGMHVSFLLALVGLLIRSRRAANLVSLPLMVLFCAITGFAPGVVRACVMRLFVTVAWDNERVSDSVTSLLVALALLLAVNPYAACGISLQLSFASTLGLVLLSGKINAALRPRFPGGKSVYRRVFWRAGVFAASVISASVSAWVFTAPLCAFYFDMISIVSPVANLLTLWSVPGAFMLGAAASVLGMIWLPLGVPFAFAAKLCVRYFTLIARVTGSGALAAVHISSLPIRLWMVLTYALIATALILKNRKKTVPLAALFSAALLSVSLLYINLSPLELSMNVLDVGQGSCTVFLSRETAVMVDCGGEDAAQKALAKMRSHGLERLDALVITHLHEDHISGVKLLLSQLDVLCVVLPQGDENIIKEIESSAGSKCVVIAASSEITVDTNELKLKIMLLRNPKSENDKGLAVLCSSGEVNALITGDMTTSGERQLCARYALPQCDVYVAGHHGDGDSSGDELLSVIRPQSAVISCGEDNMYGHPDYETVQRLKKYGAQVLRTDKNGDITLPLGEER